MGLARLERATYRLGVLRPRLMATQHGSNTGLSVRFPSAILKKITRCISERVSIWVSVRQGRGELFPNRPFIDPRLAGNHLPDQPINLADYFIGLLFHFALCPLTNFQRQRFYALQRKA